ncbi:hypothetical protein [uncultured Alistipes sp.]|uniref:hypothetical protein n=1 Tax=uncultured Alistipes sp. TaxID=538949 RepID=UPI002803F860|nr:hypothetical protein [uncultured Alistipes sp.]
MLIPVITQYLETHKRLVIPQLGAFIVKEPGRAVLFSELLKRDDGVLRGLLCARGLNELEAAGEIDRFVFEVRHAVEHGLVCPLPGLGEMKGGTNGTIVFTYDPRPTAPVAAPEPETPVAESAGAPAASHDGGVAAAGADEASGEARNPSRRPQFDAGRMAETMKSAFTEPHVSPSAKMNPDPSVRGLRYGKPPKNTDAYTYVNRVPRRRGDRFIWIAIIAAALAVAAILYGYWREAREQAGETEWMDYTDPADAPAEGGEASAGEQTSADGTACRGFVAPDPLRLRA